MRPFTICLMLLLTMCSGCLNVGPRYVKPRLNVPGHFDNTSVDQAGKTYTGKWWRSFHDNTLNNLIDQTISQNLDIRASMLRIMQMHYRLIQTRAKSLPSINLSAKGTKTRETFGINLPSLYQYKGTVDTYNLAAAASYELDIWGKLRGQSEAQRERLLEARDTRNALINSITSEVAALYFQTITIRKRIDLAKKMVMDQKRVFSIIGQRYERGISTRIELDNSSMELEQLRSSIPQLQQELTTTRQKIDLLLGRYPGKTEHVYIIGVDRKTPGKDKEDNTYAELKDYVDRMSPVPCGIPSQLLERRPDIRAAEARLKAANVLIGVAKAERFPRISLTGDYGFVSDSLKRLLRSDSMLRNMALGIVQPIYNAGALEAKQKEMEIQYKQTLMDYAKTVLNAFFEVENSLVTEKRLLEKRTDLLKACNNALCNLKIMKSRYKRGLVDYIAMLNTDKTYLEFLDRLSLLDLAIVSNRISLYRSLGGDWSISFTGAKD